MRFLFTTLQTYESAFYGRVGDALTARGHDVFHLTVSRSAARLLGERGGAAACLPDLVAADPGGWDPTAEAPRIERTFGLPSIRALYGSDATFDGLDERTSIERTVAQVRAVERHFDTVAPDVLVPEVGSEIIRRAAHMTALARGIPTLLLFYTIFPDPLRLYVDALHAPIVAPDELRPLSDDEQAELDAFRTEFIERDRPIRSHRTVSLAPRRVRVFADHVSAKRGEDRDNDYLRPAHLLKLDALALARRPLTKALYQERRPGRPFVYFPLHVTDDYKIKVVIPHCMDQASLIEQVADALPPGYDLVVKEHPMAIGRNPLALLRRVRRRANVRLLDPHVSSHQLIRESEAVAVISSTVGLEALLYRKPVLTLGEPFYSGYGVTLDVASFAEIRRAVPELLRFDPDPEQVDRFLHAAMRACRPGAPVLVDRSDENARSLATTLDEAARSVVAARTAAPTP